MLMLVRPWIKARWMVLGEDGLADGRCVSGKRAIERLCCLGTRASSGNMDEDRPKGQSSSTLRYRLEV